MSEGPIKRERAAWKPVEVSTPAAHRVCFRRTDGRGYCGRTSAKAMTLVLSEVVCADCLAARRADGKAVA